MPYREEKTFFLKQFFDRYFLAKPFNILLDRRATEVERAVQIHCGAGDRHFRRYRGNICSVDDPDPFSPVLFWPPGSESGSAS